MEDKTWNWLGQHAQLQRASMSLAQWGELEDKEDMGGQEGDMGRGSSKDQSINNGANYADNS